mgnify:CR=1 FL=1
MTITLKRDEQLEKMREAGKIVAEVLATLEAAVEPGITTQELDRIAERTIRGHAATPSFKGYRGFPGSICASVNDEIVHGFPGPRVLQEGDIISIDTGARYRGYHGDATITVPVGTVDPEIARLIAVCRRALDIGIEQAVAGNRLTDISAAIQQYVEREEAREDFKHEALSAWAAYKETGRHLTGQEVRAWLNTWGTDDERAAPECHE